MYIHTYIYIYLNVYIYAYTCVCIYIYIYILCYREMCTHKLDTRLTYSTMQILIPSAM